MTPDQYLDGLYCRSLHPETEDRCDRLAGHLGVHHHTAWQFNAATGEMSVTYELTWSTDRPDGPRLATRHRARWPHVLGWGHAASCLN